MERELKLSPENARKEVERILDFYCFDINDVKDQKQKDAINASIDKLVKGVSIGLLQVKMEPNFQVIQMLRNGKEIITYNEIGGENKCEMDGIPLDNTYQRMYTLLGSLSGLGLGAIKKLKGIDNGIAESLGTLFLLCA